MIFQKFALSLLFSQNKEFEKSEWPRIFEKSTTRLNNLTLGSEVEWYYNEHSVSNRFWNFEKNMEKVYTKTLKAWLHECQFSIPFESLFQKPNDPGWLFVTLENMAQSNIYSLQLVYLIYGATNVISDGRQHSNDSSQ